MCRCFWAVLRTLFAQSKRSSAHVYETEYFISKSLDIVYPEQVATEVRGTKIKDFNPFDRVQIGILPSGGNSYSRSTLPLQLDDGRNHCSGQEATFRRNEPWGSSNATRTINTGNILADS